MIQTNHHVLTCTTYISCSFSAGYARISTHYKVKPKTAYSVSKFRHRESPSDLDGSVSICSSYYASKRGGNNLVTWPYKFTRYNITRYVK